MVVAALPLTSLACGGGTAEERVTGPKWTTTSCPKSPPFRAHWLGEQFEDLPATHEERVCGGSPPYENDASLGSYVVYTYGTCDPGENESCVTPLEIRSYPLCVSVFDSGQNRGRRSHVRGAPSRIYAGGMPIEIYSGQTMISVSGTDRRRVARASVAVRPTGEEPGLLQPSTRRALGQAPECP